MQKRDAQKVVTIAKSNVYERLYQKLESKEGEKEVFKLARAKARRTRDLGSTKCIRDRDGEVLIEDSKLQERWQSYFYKHFNGERYDISHRGEQRGQEELLDSAPYHHITKEKIKKALRKMKARKAVGPNSIFVKIWKCLSEEALEWLTKLFLCYI